MKNGQKTLTDSASMKTHKCPTSPWKEAPYHWSSGKCKSKHGEMPPHTHQDSCYQKRKENTQALATRWGNWTLCTAGGNANWRKTVRQCLKKLNRTATCSSNSTSGHKPKHLKPGFKQMCAHRVHSGVTHCRQQWKLP